MSSRAKHVLRSHKTHQTPMHKSSDKLVPHGNPMHPTFSEKNKNKNRWPSWEDRQGKFKTREDFQQSLADHQKRVGE